MGSGDDVKFTGVSMRDSVSICDCAPYIKWSQCRSSASEKRATIPKGTKFLSTSQTFQIFLAKMDGIRAK